MTTQVAKTKGFDLQPQNMNEAMKMATMIANSQLAPKSYRNKPEDTMVAMMMGNEVGLNPMQSLQNIAVINGRPAIWGDAMLALVQSNPAFGGIKEVFDHQAWVATCTVWRKGGEKHTVTFSKEDAQTGKLWNKEGAWQTSPKRMLQLRARGFAIRDQFADALLGLISAEEAHDIEPTNDGSEEAPPRPEPKALPEYTEEQFMDNVQMWQQAIQAGKTTPERLIGKIESKHTLPESIKQSILNLDVAEAEYKEAQA